MSTTLNVTYQGHSESHELAFDAEDREILRMAAEIYDVPSDTFEGYAVDRFGLTIYVRPRVPFG